MTHKQYLSIAVPFILATITTPLLGAVDMGVMGRLPDPAYIGGVSIGVVIFNTIYWLFGFLRVSTTGLSSQALGAADRKECLLALLRPLAMALAIGSAFILLQKPILASCLHFLQPEPDVARLVETYFYILVWGAPCVLANYVMLGWLMGQIKLRASLTLQIATNALNIVLSVLFVLVFGWGVPGVAAATLIAQTGAVALGAFLIRRHFPFGLGEVPWGELFSREVMANIVRVNGDLFVRTLCLLVVTNMFVAKGASYGKDILAGNAIILQIQYLMAYFFDGLANASSVVAGKAVGKKDAALFDRCIALSWQWCLYGSILVSVAYGLSCDSLFRLFTSIPEVLRVGQYFAPWMTIFPFCASVGLVFYGIFSGSMQTAPVRNSMLQALALYVVAQFCLTPFFDNHGLMFAFLLFALGRSVFLGRYVPASRANFLRSLG
ncbi:MATE family efflux transporter [Solidesulfovibrio sp.]